MPAVDVFYSSYLSSASLSFDDSPEVILPALTPFTTKTDSSFLRQSFYRLVFPLALLVFSLVAVGRLPLPIAVAQTVNYPEGGSALKSMVATIEKPTNKKSRPFYEALEKALKKRKTTLERICPPGNPIARRILEDYGAIYIATTKVKAPPACVFLSEEEVNAFQETAGYRTETVGFDDIELQPEAMKRLMKAREEAQKEGLDITPRDGAEAARRNYGDSLRLWDTRFLPALDHWQAQQRLSSADVERLKKLPLHQQIAEVLELEKSGIFFSKDLSKSILYSIAAPGTSQHIAMLAFDVNEFDNPRVREILAKHGWFQTVLSDLPHFTFLGHKEKDLPERGLKSVEVAGQTFWIPNVDQASGR